jgi:anoctamin-5
MFLTFNLFSGLPYLLMKNVYTDAFPLHEESSKRKYKEETIEMFFEAEKEEDILEMDPRKDLDETWTKFLKFQPLWKIRNYFGEKIALYFAWSGMLTSSLWIPTVFGIGIFLYGLINRFEMFLFVMFL